MIEHVLSAGAHAFGDGSHPTTAGCLAALEAIDPTLFTPRIACDIGAGSGILAFSIIHLFACPVIATDISAQAVETLRKNAAENSIELCDYSQGFSPENTPKTTRSTDDAGTAPIGGNGATPKITPLQADGFAHPAFREAQFDLITMNILAEPLLGLASAAAHHLHSGGVLITSGILQWQEPQIREAYQSLGLELTSRLTLREWVTLVWQKP